MVAGSGLIVNADDLGIHPRIDAGIFEAFEQGVLTSATLLVTTPFTENAAREARRLKLPLGLHFSLTLGQAVASRAVVPDLVDQDNNLSLSAAKLMMLGKPNGRYRDIYRQICCEIDAQFAAACALGLSLSHVDSHQHIHTNPHIFRMLEGAAERYGLKSLRLSRERLYAFEARTHLFANLKRLNPIKVVLAGLVGHKITPRLITPDYFFGLMYSGQVTPLAMARFLAHVGRHGGVYEIGLHPGHAAPPGENVYPQPGYNDFISSPHREAELRLLTNAQTRALIDAHGIRLMSYHDLANQGQRS